MKTFLSIIDSYDEIMDFIFPPNLSFFYDEFRVGAWEMFLSQLTRKYMHAETLALLTKPLHFPNMKYLK
jgi:hypothetical protein